jgi:hypothetical protein
MTTSEYAQTLVKLIEARPCHIDLDELLAEVNVRAKIAEPGHWTTNEQIEAHSTSNGKKGTPRKSSTKSPKKRQ